MRDSLNVVWLTIAIILAMFLYMPAEQVLSEINFGLSYRLFWDMGLDGSTFYRPNVPLLAIQVLAVLGISALKILANRTR